MAWTIPAHSKRKVDEAGATYANPQASARERAVALPVINNWRSAHSFPLNTLQVNLRNVAGQFDNDPTVAQRIKRLPSIRHKLERIPGMKLSRMQDIGGCRAVMTSVDAVRDATHYYQAKSRIRHKLVRQDHYIDNPKPSGYRGVHLVYAYHSDRGPTYNGLRVEFQIRSRLQHAWATAVETVGTFTQQALKSSWGEAEWLRFFALMSSSLAMREGTPVVPNTPHDQADLVKELRRVARKLNVIKRLNAYGAALRYAEQNMDGAKGHTFLLELDTASQNLLVRGFDNSAYATETYNSLEREVDGDPDKDVVLVTVESLAALRRAYPNYFLDTSAFVASLQEAIA